MRPGRNAVPLSEHEQRLFDQIERSLAEDPKFASAVRANDPRFHARRRILVAAFMIIIGLALLVFGTASSNALLAVGGFVVMLGSAAFAMQSRRKVNAPDLHAVGGTATRRTRQTRKAGFIDRLEDRWRQRPEGHR
ncbi:membrane protein [Paractinoplanes toevensis]|uniref:Membrane protein n=1 Tax=Paractinoplanes toevensis TaxID=571911 RepID=A0A919TFS7_9ACTN|nr:membrane protein [Actinoplanes toevensis]